MSVNEPSLKRYFARAKTCDPRARRLGLEVETLFVEAESTRPISLAVSQRIFETLTARHGWSVGSRYGELVSDVERDGFSLLYDAGWNLIELNTPAELVSERQHLFRTTLERLQELYAAAASHGARPVHSSHDGSDEDTRVASCRLDELDVDMTGPSLRYQAHIAAVHYNLDLVSIEEAFAWLPRLRAFFAQREWPPSVVVENWRRSLEGSKTKWGLERYGYPPSNFDAYVDALEKLEAHVIVVDGVTEIQKPPRPFTESAELDVETYLRLVWWFVRLRVRGGQLVLEIRPTPRSTDQAIADGFENLCSAVGLAL